MLTSLNGLIEEVLRSEKTPRVAVARCADAFVLQAAHDAWEKRLAQPILIGDMDKAATVAQDLNIDISGFESLHINDDVEAVATAVRLYREKQADLIMKGLVSTATLLKAVLNKETGVPPKGILSHVCVFEAPHEDRLILLTDAAVNISPNLQRKADILHNALDVARALGIQRPKAAILAATEKVNYPAMPATLDASLLAKMGAEGAFGEADIAGPMALDVALNPQAAQTKGISNAVAGQADIICAPDIEAGNVLYKMLAAFVRPAMGGVVVGSSVPVVVPSRGDTAATKLNSLALAAYLSRRSA